MTSPISPATFAFTAVNAELASSALQSEGMVASALESGEPTAAQQDLGRLVEGRTVPTPSLRPSPRAKGGWFAGLLLGAMALVGCEFHVEPLDVVVDAGISADGGDAGNVRDGGGDGGMDGGGMVLGTQYIPTGVSPGLGSRMTPSRAFLHWSPPSAIPSGRTLAGYDACWVAGTVLDLGDETQCPNAVNTPNTYGVIGSLNAGAQYFWKVR